MMSKRQGLVAKFSKNRPACGSPWRFVRFKRQNDRRPGSAGSVYSNIAGQGCQRSFTVEIYRSTVPLWPFSCPKKPVEKVYIFLERAVR